MQDLARGEWSSTSLDADKGGVGWLDSHLGQSWTNRGHQPEDPAVLI